MAGDVREDDISNNNSERLTTMTKTPVKFLWAELATASPDRFEEIRQELLDVAIEATGNPERARRFQAVLDAERSAGQPALSATRDLFLQLEPPIIEMVDLAKRLSRLVK